VAFCLLAGAVGPALAQGISPNPASGGLFASRRTPQGTDSRAAELTMTVDFGGGYDQQPDSNEVLPSPIPLFNQTGYLGAVTGEVAYSKGWESHSVDATGSAYLNHAGVRVDRLIGGDARFEWATELGRRSGLNAAVSASYQPTSLFNAYGPVADQIEDDVPSSAPSQGVTPQEWLNTEGNVGWFRNATRHQRMEVRYTRSLRQPISGPGFVNRAHNLTYSHTWTPRETLGLRPKYRYSLNEQRDELGQEMPLESHSAELALNITKRFSPRRQLLLNLGGGMTHSRYDLPAGTSTFTLPTFSGTARMQLARIWALSVDAGRDVTILEGISPEAFATNSVAVRSETLMRRRLNLLLSAGYSRGAGAVTESSEFDTSGVTAQLQYALSRHWAMYGAFSHYRYSIGVGAPVQSGLPSRYELNSIRLGLSLWLPLYGRL
jgi:hypothetical protein